QGYIQGAGLEEQGRLRIFTPLTTFWAFLSQALNPKTSCREALRKLLALSALKGQKMFSANTSAYCQARQRLPENVLATTHEYVNAHIEKQIKSTQLWHGRTVHVVDGTGISMPDTGANQKIYPQPSVQKSGCGFPVLKLVAMFSLMSGALHTFAKGNLHDSEQTLFRKLFDCLKDGDILLGDRGFCSYIDMLTLKMRGVDTVFRMHWARSTDFRKGKRLGKRDHLITWKKPQRPRWLSPDIFATLASTMTIREVMVHVPVKGFRTRVIVIATTLLDAKKYPIADLAELYFRRWAVELYFRDIKITLGLDILRCKSPQMIHKELLMHIIAYNLIRSLIMSAAQTYSVDNSRVSFKGTLDTLRQWLPVLSSVINRKRKYRRVFQEMLHCLARDLIPFRPNRSEPRTVKRRPKNYQYMTKPRHQMGNLPHRNNPSQKSKYYA
ncbi:MAG: IS4 family transposase, partial [Candidatus Auribacterota bacterium]|nr:IS4 family transposase [Candidatus Auribacterota bacterium]